MKHRNLLNYKAVFALTSRVATCCNPLIIKKNQGMRPGFFGVCKQCLTRFAALADRQAQAVTGQCEPLPDGDKEADRSLADATPAQWCDSVRERTSA